MALLGKLFGRRSAREERARGDELRTQGELGLAKLAYERAQSLAASEPEDFREALGREINACRDGLAESRLAEAERLLREGSTDLALIELEGVIEVAASPKLIAEAERRIEATERREAREHATVAEQTEDERFETLSGSWEEEQHDEYDAYGKELRSALLALYDGKAAEARTTLERLAEEASSPRYLWFELGRARVLAGEPEAGREALSRFIAELGPEEGGESRLVAHMELAALHHERGAFDDALGEYQAAIEALPEDPRPYLAMAVFFRGQGMASEAIEVLESAREALEGEAQRQFRLTLELGLAYADLGNDERAMALLEDVISYLTSRQHIDLPPECAVPLARLHEKAGNKARALDLYNLLASGSDVANRFVYHCEAARLLSELGHDADARRMLQRAEEFLPEDANARAAFARQKAELK